RAIPEPLGCFPGPVGYPCCVDIETLTLRYPVGADLLVAFDPDLRGGDALVRGDPAGEPGFENDVAFACDRSETRVEFHVDGRVVLRRDREGGKVEASLRRHRPEHCSPIDVADVERAGDETGH